MNTFSKNAAQKKLIGKLTKAVEYLNTNQLDQARKICRNITKTNPKIGDAWHILAIAEKQSGQFKSALYAFDKAIQADPSNPNFHYNLAVTYHEAGMADHAIQSYRRSVNLNANNAAALDNLGVLLQQKMHIEEALEHHLKANAIQPTPNCYNNLGECYRKLDKPELAIEAYENAIRMAPNFAGALKNMGNLHKEMGEFDQASELLQKAVAIENTAANNQVSVDALWNQANLLLLQGRFGEGWPKYEYGIQQGTRTFIDYGYLTWKGNHPDSQSILIIGEQGIGDEMMFASCFDEAINRFKQVTIECDPRLVPIFQRTFNQAVIIARGDDAAFSELQEKKVIDVQLPAGSLANYFRRHQDDFPGQQQFLYADDDKIQYWQDKLATLGNQLKIGIAWRGGRAPMIIKKRSTPLQEWQSVLQTSSAQFINLQYGDCQEDIDWVYKQFGVTIHQFDEIDPLKDLDNYAALIDCLDLVLSIDNSVVHLAGALGQKTWVLLPYIPDWRWQMDTSTSVWYPSIHLFRQTEKDQWSPVFSAVEAQLSHLIDHPSSMTATKTTQIKRALLLNDTSSWYHWGCTCTSGAILQQLADMGYATDSVTIKDSEAIIYSPNTIQDVQSDDFHKQFIEKNAAIIDKIQASDVVILNGEGSLHGASSLVLTLLLLVKIAKQVYQKVVHIINHSCYPEESDQHIASPISQLYQSIYSTMDSVAIREPISAQLIRSMGIDVIQSFDCLPLYLHQNQIGPFKEKHDYIVISGSVILNIYYIDQLVRLMHELHGRGLRLMVLTGARAYPAREDEQLIERLKQKADMPWQWVDAKSAIEWLRMIGQAQMLISGRFHHSIAAAFLKTPFIALNSNTPKINGILQMLELPKPISMDSKQLSETLIKQVISILEKPSQWLVSDDILNKLRQLANHNFAAIEIVA